MARKATRSRRNFWWAVCRAESDTPVYLTSSREDARRYRRMLNALWKHQSQKVGLPPTRYELRLADVRVGPKVK